MRQQQQHQQQQRQLSMRQQIACVTHLTATAAAAAAHFQHCCDRQCKLVHDKPKRPLHETRAGHAAAACGTTSSDQKDLCAAASCKYHSNIKASA
jgi:hypothetical protein